MEELDEYLWQSEQAANRVFTCVHCGRRTDWRLESCESCGHVWTVADRDRMHARRLRPRESLLDTIFPAVLVAVVVLVIVNW